MNKGLEIFLTKMWNDIQNYNNLNMPSHKPIVLLYHNTNKDLYLSCYSQAQEVTEEKELNRKFKDVYLIPIKENNNSHNYPYIYKIEEVDKQQTRWINFVQEEPINNFLEIKNLTELLNLFSNVNNYPELKNFNKIRFLSFLLSTENKTKKTLLIKQISHILYPLAYQWKNDFNYLEEMAKLLSFEDFKFVIKSMPNNLVKTNTYNSNIDKILKIFQTHFSEKEKNELLFILIMNKKKILSHQKRQQIRVRDFLLEHFNSGSEEDTTQLNKYAKELSFIEYAINKDTSKNYIEKRKNRELMYIEINVFKMISFNAIERWNRDRYLDSLKLLLNHIESQYKGIETINFFVEKDDNKEEYICINIYKNNEEIGLSQQQLEKIIFDFFFSLKENLPKKYLYNKDKINYINTWFSQYKLKMILPLKTRNNKNIKKI